MKITSELIDAFQFYYGGSKKNAMQNLKERTEDCKKELLKGYYEQLKRAFYED